MEVGHHDVREPEGESRQDEKVGLAAFGCKTIKGLRRPIDGLVSCNGLQGADGGGADVDDAAS